ncbi:MAG: hypothetical protein U1A27_09820 [Phycisphaerae bacterium]
MIDRQTFAIGVLSITAAVLLVGILVVASLPAPALAVGQTDRGGDYLMVTSQFNTGTELVFVVDGAVGRMIAYAYNLNTHGLQLWDQLEFSRVTRNAEKPADDNTRRRK